MGRDFVFFLEEVVGLLPGVLSFKCHLRFATVLGVGNMIKERSTNACMLCVTNKRSITDHSVTVQPHFGFPGAGTTVCRFAFAGVGVWWRELCKGATQAASAQGERKCHADIQSLRLVVCLTFVCAWFGLEFISVYFRKKY